MKKIIIVFYFIVGNLFHLYAQDAAKKPNIIFILVDDLGYGDLGIFFQQQRQKAALRNEPWLHTPNLDKMAVDGAILPHHYAAAPVCAPSRASILSGVSQGHANVRDNQFDKALEDNYTLGNVLQKTGYSTAAIGKWGLQGEGEAPNWPAHPLNRGFDYYFGYIAHVDGHEHYPKEGLYRGRKDVWENYDEISDQLDKCYTGDLFTAVAKRYIIDHQKEQGDQPFFMYLAYDTPHAVLELPTQAYPEGKGLKGGLQWLGEPGNMINTASGTIDSYIYPEYVHAKYDHDNDPTTPEIPWPDTYKRYASVTFRIDEQIGDILQLLEDLQIAENTLVVFTSDNGPSNESYLPKTYVSYEADFFRNFGPFEGIKRDVYEGGLRVPTIVWWPGTIASHTAVNIPSISYDWLPTFVELAGCIAPIRSDGVSLVPALTNKRQQDNSLIYVEYFHPGNTLKYPDFAPERRGIPRKQMQMLRLGDTVGVRYDIQSADDDFEIYDVAHDPQQLHNLAEKNKAMQQLMKNRVLQVRISDTSAVRPYDNVLIPSIKSGAFNPGLKKKTYKINTSWIANTRGIEPISVSITNKLNSNNIITEVNTVVFEGYIKVPEDGAYTFYLSTDDKAFMRIHDITVIDADYGYSPGQVKQCQLPLEAGYHPIRIYYKAKSPGNVMLNMQWSYEDSAQKNTPDSLFFN